MVKRISKRDLIEEDRVKALIAKDPQAQALTNNFRTFGSGKFIELKGRELKDGRVWDLAVRKAKVQPVTIIAQEENSKEYLFIAQIRPPLQGKKMVLSFPAGLIEDKKTVQKFNEVSRKRAQELNVLPELFPDHLRKFENDSIIRNAIFELKEEAGVFPRTCTMLSNPANPMPKSAGFGNEMDNVVLCRFRQQDIGYKIEDPGESIVSLSLTKEEFLDTVEKLPPKYVKVENNAWMYMKGLVSNGQDRIQCPKDSRPRRVRGKSNSRGIWRRNVHYCKPLKKSP